MANLTMVMARPTSYIILDVVKQLVQTAKLLLDRYSIMLMLCCVDVFSYLQDLIRFAVGFRISRIVGVIEVQVETEVVGKFFKTTREIINV